MPKLSPAVKFPGTLARMQSAARGRCARLEEVVEGSDVISKQSPEEEDSDVVGLGRWRGDNAFHLNSSNRKANHLMYGRFYRGCVVSLAPCTQK